jgi:hypothetical protein
MYEIQSLGRLDASLLEQEEIVLGLAEDSMPEPTDRLSEYLDLSRLWVLSAYELIRTLDASVRAGLWNPGPLLADALQELKQQLAVVRMPLAKFEPAFKRAEPGDLVAEPGFTPGGGASWNISESAEPTIVTRNDLSDGVIAFFERCRSANPHLPD